MLIHVAANLPTCHRCDHGAKRGCDTKCVCSADPQGRDIEELARTNYCPLDLFASPAFTHESPVEVVMEAMAKPLKPNLSPTWYKSGNAQEAMRRLMRLAADRELPHPPWSGGRGVVIAGGGIYFDSAYVVVRMLQYLGCKLPIQVWHLGPGEIKSWQRDAIVRHGVELVDAHEVAKEHPCRRLGGWELKPFAITHSPFSEVLFLDADCIPLRDPTFLFDQPEYVQTGALFWPDQPVYDLKPDQWRLVGLPFRDERAVESGELVIDKTRCWRELNLALWMNEHSDFYYRFVHGDKETFHLAWRYLGSDYGMPTKRWRHVRPAMIQHDFDGKPLFAHRSEGKFTLVEEQEGNQYFKTTGQYGPTVRYNPSIPLEDEQWRFLRELGAYRDAHDDHAGTFVGVYQRDEWGGGSGSGSRPNSTELYRRLLQLVVNSGRVKRVVDLGCGDWQFSQLVNWSGVEYVGLDVVPGLIEANREKFQTDRVRFEVADLRNYDPSGDPPETLYLVKDVLQHWTRGQVQAFLGRFVLAGREVLITNTAEQPGQAKLNSEIETGGFRPLDITAPPFNQPAELILDYTVNGDDRKKTLLVYGENSLLRDLVPQLKELWRPLSVVQLGRNGDMLVLLPALKYLTEKEGRQIRLITRHPYNQIFRGQKWLDVITVDCPEEDWERARTLGLTMAGECRVSQVGHVQFTPKHPHWALEQWLRLGVPVDLYDSLPLEVVRNPEAEAQIVHQHIPTNPRRPLILYNGTGLSSPFDGASALYDSLRGYFKGCQVLDLATVQADNLLDLLGLYELAELVVSCDTSTLHLGRVLKTPTVALVRDEVWGQSPTCSHWKLRLTYAEATSEEGLRMIKKAIGEILVGNREPMSLPQKIAHGAAGVAKALVGLGGASDGQIQTRLRVCEGCDKYVRTLGFPQCRMCGCLLEAKVKNAGESCPMGKW